MSSRSIILGLDALSAVSATPADILGVLPEPAPSTVGVVSRLRRPKRPTVITAPTTVIVSPRGGASIIFDSTGIMASPPVSVARVEVTGGQHSTLDKGSNLYFDASRVVVTPKSGAARSFDNVQTLTVYGGVLKTSVLGDVDPATVTGADADPLNAVPPPPNLKSPLDGVSDAQWSKFCRLMATQKVGDVSESNALGMFAMRPRRLADLGYIESTATVRTPKGRQVFVGDFKPPLTAKKFLANAMEQYRAFVRSVKDHWTRLKGGKIKKPDWMSDSGALAALHRGGPPALEKRMSDTAALVERVDGVF